LSDHSYSPENSPPDDIQARPKNWLVPVVLVILRECTTYGYELMQRTVELGFEAMNPGTLYRTLRKMEQDGLCKSAWETASEGPARRMYSITAAGEAYLDLWVKSLEQYQRTMEAFFQAYRRDRSGSEQTESEPY
jgi:PadR family transcriptional regulator, regulatory protein PadR